MNLVPDQHEHQRVAFFASEPLPADDREEPAVTPLTWAQQHMMGFIDALHPATASLNLRFTCQLRRGLTVSAVLSAVRDLVQACEALRTLYVPPPAGPAQRCLMTGELLVDIVHAPDETAGATAAEISGDLAARPFVIVSELPVRVALVCVKQEPRYLAFAVSHLMVDFEGTRRVKDHLSAVSAERATVKPSAGIHQPRHEAEWERSPAGQQAARRAIENHTRTLLALPQTMLPREGVEPEQPRFRYLTLESWALAAAVPSLADQHRASTTAVLYAAIAAVTGYLSGLPRASLQLTVGNRSQQRRRDAVSMFTQDVPAYVDLSGASVGSLIDRASVAILQAARFGQYPPDSLAAARAAVELERGISLDLSCWLNHRLPSSRPRAASARPGRRMLDQLGKHTRWRWAGADERSTSSYFIHADESARAITLTMLFDTAIIPRGEAVAILRSLESLLCAAALDEVALADAGQYMSVAPPTRTADWCLSDHTWAHLPTITALVRMAARAAADVFAVQARDGTRLTAFLAAPPDLPVTRLHAMCVAALAGRRTAMAPHWYVLCDEPPRARDLHGWSGCRVLAEGSGRQALQLTAPRPAAGAS